MQNSPEGAERQRRGNSGTLCGQPGRQGAHPHWLPCSRQLLHKK